MKGQLKHTLRRHRPWDVVRFVAHLPNFVKLFTRLLGDARVTLFPKLLLFGAALYAVTPVDFLSDLMPLLGQLDDLAIFGMACRFFLRLCPPEVVREHVAEIDRTGRWTP